MEREKRICPQVNERGRTLEERERVIYLTALEALQESRRNNERFSRFSSARYCPACSCWHITTHRQDTGVTCDLDTGAVFVGETKSGESLESLAERAEALVEEMKFILRVMPLINGINLKKSTPHQLWMISTGDFPLGGIDSKTRHEIISYCVKRLSYLGSSGNSEISKKLDLLSRASERRQKAVLITDIRKISKSIEFMFEVYPSYRGNLEAEINKYR